LALGCKPPFGSGVVGGRLERREDLPRDAIEVLEIALVEPRHDAPGDLRAHLLDALANAPPRGGELENVLAPIFVAALSTDEAAIDQALEHPTGQGGIGHRGARERGLGAGAALPELAEQLRLHDADVDLGVCLCRDRADAPPHGSEQVDELGGISAAGHSSGVPERRDGRNEDKLTIIDLSTIFMDMSINIESARTALLVMDLQQNIVKRFADGAAGVIERAAELIAAARRARIPVIYVVVGFRPGYPEVSPRNKLFATLAQSGLFVASTPGDDIVPELRPETEDIIVTKHRVGAFAGTDLDMILRARGIDTLLVTGLATSGVVLSTVRYGADADYRLVVVADCCADADDEVHRVLTGKVLVRQAEVVAAADLVGALAAP
jgi:nicotinamidase-related amidase